MTCVLLCMDVRYLLPRRVAFQMVVERGASDGKNGASELSQSQSCPDGKLVAVDHSSDVVSSVTAFRKGIGALGSSSNRGPVYHQEVYVYSGLGGLR